jgi:hypothetical protein
MVTLISWHTSGGAEGRCDAKCYEAREPACDCICGGRNHGAGRQQAETNTMELAEKWVEHAHAQGWTTQLGDPAIQYPLFPLSAGGSNG